MTLTISTSMCLSTIPSYGANYRTISDFQGISKASMGRCVNEVVQFLGSLYYEYICWPTTREELEEKALRFFQKFGKPCTIGCIDGTHIPILRPCPEMEYSFLNRKAFHSMNVLVNIFINIFALYFNCHLIINYCVIMKHHLSSII